MICSHDDIGVPMNQDAYVCRVCRVKVTGKELFEAKGKVNDLDTVRQLMFRQELMK